MPSRPPPPESVPKDEESEGGTLDRFRSLARGLFGVPREQYEEKEEAFKATRNAARQIRKDRGHP